MQFTTTRTMMNNRNIVSSESYDQIYGQVLWNDIIDNYDNLYCYYEMIHDEMKHFENISNKEMEVSRDPGLSLFSVAAVLSKSLFIAVSLSYRARNLKLHRRKFLKVLIGS